LGTSRRSKRSTYGETPRGQGGGLKEGTGLVGKRDRGVPIGQYKENWGENTELGILITTK